MRAENNFERRQCLTYLGSNRKKCNGHRQSFRKDEATHLTFEKGVITATFLWYELEVASLFNNALVFYCEEKLCRLYFG